jgi:hypothetical protein
MTIGGTVGHARGILESAEISVRGAARVASEGREMATILLQSDQDVPKGMKVLILAVIDVKEGAAGF